MVAYSHAQDLYPTNEASRQEMNPYTNSRRLGKVSHENRIPIRLCSRLSLYFRNIGGASAKSNPKTAFSICLCSRLSLYLYPSTAGNDDSHSRQPMDTLPQKASWALTETCET